MRAWAVPPQYHFQTLESEHLYVHYHDGYKDLAEDVVDAGEQALATLQEHLGWNLTDKVELTIVDDTDDANGFAQVAPYPQVQIFVTAPEDISFLSEYDDWMYELVGHELLHVVHLDTHHGISKIINKVLGRSYFPNQIQSSWFVEGLAVEGETRISQGGRLRSKLADMVFRAEQIAGRPIRLDEAVSDPLRFPQGTARYLHGGRFLAWVADKYGSHVLREISHKYAESLIPLAMNRAFKAVTGVDYDVAWDEFQDDLQRHYAQQLSDIQARPIVQGRQLTHLGQYTNGPRFLPDGRISYFASAMGVLPTMRAIDPQTLEDKPLSQITASGTAARADQQGRVLFSQSEVHKNFFSFYDLFYLDANQNETGRSFRRLTEGRRFREPDVSADGRYVYFIQNMGMRSRLMRAPINDTADGLELGPEQVLWDPPRHYQLYTPRVSPDGKSVAVSVHRPPGQRDIALVPLNDATKEPAVQWLTSDLAMDGGPLFTRDGELLLFHSARSGVFNLYAYRFSDGVIQQITNVLTGAFSVDLSADEKTLAYVGYSEQGYDVWAMPFDRQQLFAASEPAPNRIETLTERPHAYAVAKPYSPWRGLLPWQWLPVMDGDAKGTVLGLSTGGRDPLGRHSWSAEFGYGLDSNDLVYSLGYQNRQLYPLLQLSADRRQQVASGATVVNQESLLTYERAHRFGADIVVPFTRAVDRFDFSLSYQFDHRTRLTRYSFEPDQPKPQLPAPGNFAGVSLSASYSNTRRTLGAVSSEYGQRIQLSGTLRERWLGSDFRQGFLSVAVQHFQPMPWLRNHVLSLRLATNLGYSDTATRPLFQLGGLPIRDFVRDFVFGGGASDSGLRGYRLAAFSGNMSFLGTAEYRAPLWRIERGLSVFPFYFRTLSAAAFVDVGSAADPKDLFKRVGVGVGAELRLEIDYGFFYASIIRLGYARGLSTKEAVHNVFVFLSNGF